MVKINAFIKDISEFGIRRSKAEMQNDETSIMIEWFHRTGIFTKLNRIATTVILCPKF